MVRLSDTDAAFLQVETPTAHMHVLGLVVLRPPDGGSITAQTLAEHVGERLGKIARFRRRAIRTPLDLIPPVLVEGNEFRVEQHIEQVTLGTPGDFVELAKLVGKIAQQPLDRTRPLWEAWIIDGLEDGRIALVTKIHHALIDGAAGTEVLAKLFDLSPDGYGDTIANTPEDDDDGYAALQVLGATLSSAIYQPLRILRATTNTVTSLARAFYDPLLADADAKDLAAKPFTAPRNVFSGALSAERVIGFGRVALGDVLTIKRAYDATVNDVVLAACTDALRDYLLSRGESVNSPLVASVPISLAHDEADLGNHVSVMFVFLPIHLADTEAQVNFIKGSTAAAKQARHALGDTLLDDWLAAVPAPLLRIGAQLFSSLRLADVVRPAHNLVISNVQGPNFPLYSAGALVESCYPIGPVMEGAALNVTVMSYRDNIDLGIIACPRAVPDPARITRGFERAVHDTAEYLRAKQTLGNGRALPSKSPTTATSKSSASP